MGHNQFTRYYKNIFWINHQNNKLKSILPWVKIRALLQNDNFYLVTLQWDVVSLSVASLRGDVHVNYQCAAVADAFALLSIFLCNSYVIYAS
jgi:hypothetical protein